MKEINNVISDMVKNLWLMRQDEKLKNIGLDSSATLKTRFKDFPYIVKVKKPLQDWLSIHADVDFWCEEHCGAGYNSHWLEGYYKDDDLIIDHRVGIPDREQAFFYGFKNEADATMFTLRWLGNG